MKRIITVLLVCLLGAAVLSAFSGCALAQSAPGDGNDRFRVVSTIFPPYDWVRQILGDDADNFELSFLTGGGVDLHSFQPSVSDIVRISSSDMFIYVGGHSDGWVADVLSGAINPDMIVINLMDVLGDAVHLHAGHHHHHHHHHHSDGEECDHPHHSHHHHSHDHHDCDDDECEHDHHDQDEHIWLSLNFAKTLSTAIANGLMELDPANADAFRANLTAYIGRLWVLNAEFEAMVNSSAIRTVLFADRFPFYYLMRDYGLSHYAAFPGCHAETEASFTTIVFLINRVNDLGLANILVTESSDKSIAATIARDSNGSPQILVLDSMQSITARDVENGATYLSIMESNLEVLREALR